jgi:hypothetical protein
MMIKILQPGIFISITHKYTNAYGLEFPSFDSRQEPGYSSSAPLSNRFLIPNQLPLRGCSGLCKRAEVYFTILSTCGSLTVLITFTHVLLFWCWGPISTAAMRAYCTLTPQWNSVFHLQRRCTPKAA